MYLYTKVIFIILISFSYFSIFLSGNTNLKALNKVFLISFASLIFLGIIFQETIMNNLAEILGVGYGPEAILYLFICMSLSINFILAKKVIILEGNIKKVVQKISLLTEKKY
tara:strand:- start:832 stop:1167 length:336 start_codon:yes stop_codon:yes gene_type:complete